MPEESSDEERTLRFSNHNGPGGAWIKFLRERTGGAMSRHPNPATFVLIPGAWHGGWCYAETAKILRGRGHTVFNPSLTGVADRAHLLGPDVNTTTHILDVVNLVEAEQLQKIVLVGHSYAGNVIAAASERIADRIAAIVYLDAFVPEDDADEIFVLGEQPEIVRQQAEAQFAAGNIAVEPLPMLIEAYGWARYRDRLTPMPGGVGLEHVPLSGRWKDIPNKTFVWAKENVVHGRATYERLSQSPEWRTEVYDGNHMIMIDDPDVCAEILERAIPA
jgi:pimeloyl-ACP methyl ester carboxylesterase